MASIIELLRRKAELQTQIDVAMVHRKAWVEAKTLEAKAQAAGMYPVAHLVKERAEVCTKVAAMTVSGTLAEHGVPNDHR